MRKHAKSTLEPVPQGHTDALMRLVEIGPGTEGGSIALLPISEMPGALIETGDGALYGVCLTGGIVTIFGIRRALTAAHRGSPKEYRTPDGKVGVIFTGLPSNPEIFNVQELDPHEILTVSTQPEGRRGAPYGELGVCAMDRHIAISADSTRLNIFVPFQSPNVPIE